MHIHLHDNKYDGKMLSGYDSTCRYSDRTILYFPGMNAAIELRLIGGIVHVGRVNPLTDKPLDSIGFTIEPLPANNGS